MRGTGLQTADLSGEKVTVGGYADDSGPSAFESLGGPAGKEMSKRYQDRSRKAGFECRPFSATGGRSLEVIALKRLGARGLDTTCPSKYNTSPIKINPVVIGMVDINHKEILVNYSR